MSKQVISMDLEKYVNSMKLKGLVKEKKGNVATLCPECYKLKVSKGEHGYRNLKLWIDDGLNYGHCWVCGTVYISDDRELRTSVKRLEKSFDMKDWKLCKLGEDGYWNLSKFETFDEDDPIGIDYLAKKRCYIYRKLYKSLGIRFHDHNPVVPFYYKGELIFYQIRNKDYDKNIEGSIKYFTPPTDHKNPYILENGEDKKFIICEGTFDAIGCKILYPDRTPFAVLGSDITPYQIGMLRTYCPEDILIYMDKTEISYRIKSAIEEYIDYAEINIVESNGEDPEEHMKAKLMEELF